MGVTNAGKGDNEFIQNLYRMPSRNYNNFTKEEKIVLKIRQLRLIIILVSLIKNLF